MISSCGEKGYYSPLCRASLRTHHVSNALSRPAVFSCPKESVGLDKLIYGHKCSGLWLGRGYQLSQNGRTLVAYAKRADGHVGKEHRGAQKDNGIESVCGYTGNSHDDDMSRLSGTSCNSSNSTSSSDLEGKGTRRAWNKGKRLPESVKEKISERMRRKWQDPEYKMAVSCALKGKEPWNKGLTLSEETREKMRLAKMNHVVSRSTRQKMSAAHRGKTLAPETAAAVSEALRGRPKSEEHKAAIAASQRRRHAAARVLRAVENVYNETDAASGKCSIHDGNASLPRESRMNALQDFKSKRHGKAQLLNAYKAELREYRALQEELSPWTQAFVNRHGRKPTMIDVQRTGIQWLVARYKQYILIRDRLFNETNLLRAKLDGAIPDPSSIRQNIGNPAGRQSLGDDGVINANSPSITSKAVLTSRLQAALQYKANKSKSNKILKLDSLSKSPDEDANADSTNFEGLEGLSACESKGNLGKSNREDRLDVLAEHCSNSPNTPSRVRSAMSAAMEYRRRKAEATRAAAASAAARAGLAIANKDPSTANSLEKIGEDERDGMNNSVEDHRKAADEDEAVLSNVVTIGESYAAVESNRCIVCPSGDSVNLTLHIQDDEQVSIETERTDNGAVLAPAS